MDYMSWRVTHLSVFSTQFSRTGFTVNNSWLIIHSFPGTTITA